MINMGKEVWSDLHHELITDSQGRVKKVLDVDAVYTSIDNILRTYQGERCLSGDTKIPLLDGTEVEIRNLVGKKVWVFSINPRNGMIEPALAVGSYVGREKVVKILLDNGESIICTPDHRFMLRDGSYKYAGCLQPFESLMPFYVNDGDYAEIYQPKVDKWEKIYRVVARWKLGHDIEKGWCIHHKNFMSKDNRPENLLHIPVKKHWLYHSKVINFRLWHSPEFQWFRDKVKNGYLVTKTKGNPEFSKAIKLGIKKHLSNPKNAKKWSERSRRTIIKTNSRPEMKELLRNIGRKNGIDFWYSEHMAEARERNLKAMQTAVKNWQQTSEGQNVLKSVGHDVGKNNVKAKFIKHSKIIKEKFGIITEDIWESYRKCLHKNCGLPNWKTILEHGYLQELNHKVISVEHIDKELDVYDLFVENNHNFAISAGVFVHNCMLPEFASRLKSMVFEPITPSLARLLSDEVKRVIELWDDRVKVQGVDFSTDPDRNFVNLTIRFIIRGYSQVFTHSVEIRE